MRGGGYLVARSGELVTREGRALLGAAELEAMGLDPGASRALSSGAGAPARLVVAPEGVELPEGFAASGLRALLGTLAESEVELAMRAVQVAGFLDTHRFCGRCGAETQDVPDELSRRCPRCDLGTYPRIAPAVIVLVRRGEQALLARSARFPLPFFSTLAGFVEIGERLEDTVHREIREEVGVEVEDVRYFGSQPWPFPHSLMIGFTARYRSGDLTPDGKEIVEASFFDAHALPRVPPPFSIARRLIDAWVAEVQG